MTTAPLEFPLAELTTTLVRDVFQSITDTAMEQADAYARLAGEVGMSVEEYQTKILGLTEAQEQQNIADYVRNGVMPVLLLPTTHVPDTILFAEAREPFFLAHFERVFVGEGNETKFASDLVTKKPGEVFPCSITRKDLEKLVRAKILRDAALAHTRVTMLLKTGLPNIVVTGGQINTKVTMTITQATAETQATPLPGPSVKKTNALGVRVRVANERSMTSAKTLEVVGSVRIDFRAGVFPPIDPGPAKR